MAKVFARGAQERRSGRRLARVRKAQGGSRARAAWVLAVISAALLWCNGAVAAEPRVLLLRGWFGVFSTGLDSLADELKPLGITAEVAGHLYWSTAVTNIMRERAAGKTGPLVLVGHSQGANNVIDMARALMRQNVPVELLVTLAPMLQNNIPANVVRAINYYQSPGWGSPITAEPGFRGKLTNVDVAGDPAIFHISIDKSPKIHAEIVREIAALAQAR
jgi:hypothetical protein